MVKIVSRRARPEPPQVEPPVEYNPQIIVNPDGSWSFPTGTTQADAIDANDEEVLKKTVEGVDINYINTEDC